MKKILITILIFALLFGGYLVKESLALEPLTSSIVNVGNSSSVRIPTQDFGFYAAGRFWVFYQDPDYDFEFKSSTDGINWSNATTIQNSATQIVAAMHDVYFDGTNVHYIRNDHTNVGNYDGCYYRRGVPQSDGTITWAAAEQTILNKNTEYLHGNDISLTVDSNGYPWVGMKYGTTSARGNAYVFKSSTNDGTWITASGYPKLLYNNPINTWLVKILTQTNGKVYAVVYNNGVLGTKNPIYGYAYDGANWGNQETITTSELKGYGTGGDFDMMDAISVGDDVHLVFQAYGTNDIRYVKRDGVAGTWSAEEIIAGSSWVSATDSSPVLTSWDADTLLAFWVKKPVIYSLTQLSGVWQATTTPNIFLTDNNIVIDQERCLQAYNEPLGGYGGIFYLPTISSVNQQTFVSYQYVAEEESAPPPTKAVGFVNGTVFKDKVIIKN